MTSNENTATLSYDLYGQFEPTVHYPGDNCCTFYNHKGFDGEVRTLCHYGQEIDELMEDLEDGAFNNLTSSFYCGKNTWWNMCRDYDGECDQDPKHISSGAGFVRNYDMDVHDWNNTLSRIQMGPYVAETLGAVNLYRASNCIGNSARVYWNPDDLDAGQYSLENLQ